MVHNLKVHFQEFNNKDPNFKTITQSVHAECRKPVNHIIKNRSPIKKLIAFNNGSKKRETRSETRNSYIKLAGKLNPTTDSGVRKPPSGYVLIRFRTKTR